MRVTIISNLDAACGIGEYGRNLYLEISKIFPSTQLTTLDDTFITGSVVLVNYCSAVVPLTLEHVRKWKSQGRVVVILHHQSYENETREVTPFIGEVDNIITHEPTDYSVYIPHGVPEVEDLHKPAMELTLGLAGFYSWVKQFETVLEVARKTNGVVNFICTPHKNSPSIQKAVLNMKGHPRDRIDSIFLPVEDVIRRLSESTANIFWFKTEPGREFEYEGQSGSVGLGLATKRPVILSRHRKFKVLLEKYSDEVYVADTKEDLVTIVNEIASSKVIKRPNRIMKDMGWSTTGKQIAVVLERNCEGKNII